MSHYHATFEVGNGLRGRGGPVAALSLRTYLPAEVALLLHMTALVHSEKKSRAKKYIRTPRTPKYIIPRRRVHSGAARKANVSSQ